MKLEMNLLSCTKNFNRIKDLNVNSEFLICAEELIGSIVHGIGIAKNFLIRTLFAQELSTTID